MLCDTIWFGQKLKQDFLDNDFVLFTNIISTEQSLLGWPKYKYFLISARWYEPVIIVLF